MAQVTILTAGTDATPSAEFTIGPTERAKVSLFPGSGSLDVNAGAAVFRKGTRPAGYPYDARVGLGTETQAVAQLGSGVDTAGLPVIWLADPGTYYVTRSQGAAPAAFGAYVDVTSRYSG